MCVYSNQKRKHSTRCHIYHRGGHHGNMHDIGHTHPLGMLWYLATGSVALFHTTEEMQWVLHGAVKAMELQDEPIAIQIVAASEHHIRAYITIVGGDPSKLQSPPSEGEGDAHSPTGNPHPGGGTLHCLQAELGDLVDQELHQLMEDLHQEVALCELHAPPAILNQLLGDNLQGAVILMGMTRRSPFQEGEGGFPPDNHLQLLFQHDQMEDGFLKDHLLSTQGLLLQIQMWVPNQHFSFGVMLVYPQNKHIQW